MKKIIMSADDFAQSADIDAGILQLIQAGRITAASCLTLSPRWQQAAKDITPEIRKQADVGLHLDFTLYPQALKHNHSTLIIKAYGRRLPYQAIIQSIHHQLDLFESALNTPPDYIDGHQHVHQLPQIRDALIEAVTLRYPKQLPWIRITQSPKQNGWKARIIGLLGANSLQHQVQRAKIKHTKVLLGVYGFDADKETYERKLNAWFSLPQKEVAAFMCHPAISQVADDHTNNSDPIYPARLIEYEVFAHDNFEQLLQQHQITLVRGNAISSAEM